jgi:hypothetical protein
MSEPVAAEGGLDSRALSPVVHWQISGALVGYCDRLGHRFSVSVVSLSDEWQVLALVSPRPEPDASRTEQATLLFDNHAHHDYGLFDDFDDARSCALDFLLDSPVPERACACEDLGGEAEPPHIEPDVSRWENVNGVPIFPTEAELRARAERPQRFGLDGRVLDATEHHWLCSYDTRRGCNCGVVPGSLDAPPIVGATGGEP